MANFKVYYHTSETMYEVEGKSIQTIVTSPPYNINREYENGYDDGKNWIEYSMMLTRVFAECYRVLKDNGAMFVNIGNNVKDPQKSFRIVKLITDLGFYLRDTVIWLKTNPVPNNGFHLTNRYEFVFLFAKKKSDRIKFKKLRISNEKIGKVDKWGRERKQEWRDIGNVWSFPVVKQGWFGDDGHCAMFPADLPKLAILSSSDKRDFILDPFLGSATTCQVALHLKRKCIGYDINKKYKKIIEKKIKKTPKFMVNVKSDLFN